MLKKSFILTTFAFLLAGCFGSDTETDTEPENDSNNAPESTPAPDPPEATFAYNDIEVSTWAGTGIMGLKDDQKKESTFAFPSGIVEGADGLIYISDRKNHRIRAIDENGMVHTFAGTTDEKDDYGHAKGGFQDGPATEAMFNEPKGLAFDSDGNLYVADSENGAIRKIDQDQHVTTFADDLLHPSDIVIGPDGDIFVSETLKHRILKISQDGEVSVFAGGDYQEQDGWYIGEYQEGVGENAKFNEPAGLAFGPDGTLYVVDSANQRIREISPEGSVSTLAGSGTEISPGTSYITGGFADGDVSEARFNFPQSIEVADDGTIFLTDTHNHRIRIITTDNEVTTLAGTGWNGHENGDSEEANFNGPKGILILNNDSLLVTDRWNYAIRNIEFTY